MYFKTLILLLFLVIPVSAYTQTDICIAWWNLENLFDTKDDPYKGDDDFLPSGKKEWTNHRLHQKIVNLSEVINSMNDGQGPDILGFCEVEHESMVDSLLNYIHGVYGKVYYESSDRRGIDIGMIYNKKKISFRGSEAHPVRLKNRNTREILQVNVTVKPKTFSLFGGKSMIILLNHWPSRIGGQLESEPRRMEVAEELRKIVDYLCGQMPTLNILIMGDFNDEPGNKSIDKGLQTINSLSETSSGDPSCILYNPMYGLKERGLGSYYHNNQWLLIDQFLVSKTLAGSITDVKIYNPDFMIYNSKRKKGRPLPTYSGSKYIGGFSDHFPIVMFLYVK